MRPSEYDPKYCEVVIESGKKGKSITQMAIACGVAKKTLYNWCDAYDEFLHAVDLAKAYSQSWWENTGQASLYADKFQSTVYNRQMANRFREDHGEVKEVVQRQSCLISSEPLSAEEWEKLYSDDSESE
jgi:hypothetical protein